METRPQTHTPTAPTTLATAPTIASTLDSFVAALAGRKYSANTIDTYRRCMVAFAAHLGSESTLDQITHLSILGYQAGLRHCEAATISKALSAIRAYCRWCVRAKLRADDPSLDLVWPKRQQPLPRHLSSGELRELEALLARPLPVLDKKARWMLQRDRRAVLLMLYAGLRLSEAFYNLRTAGIAEAKRVQLNHAMAALFEQVDLVIAATNPGPAFPAHHQMSSPPPPIAEKLLESDAGRVAARGLLGMVRFVGGIAPSAPSSILGKVTEIVPDMLEMGGLTIPSNIYGNPAVSIPAGLLGGLPIGMQVLARHHEDALLLDVALTAERELGWPKLATRS